jgi:hypothetical protein
MHRLSISRSYKLFIGIRCVSCYRNCLVDGSRWTSFQTHHHRASSTGLCLSPRAALRQRHLPSDYSGRLGSRSNRHTHNLARVAVDRQPNPILTAFLTDE